MSTPKMDQSENLFKNLDIHAFKHSLCMHNPRADDATNREMDICHLPKLLNLVTESRARAMFDMAKQFVKCNAHDLIIDGEHTLSPIPLVDSTRDGLFIREHFPGIGLHKPNPLSLVPPFSDEYIALRNRIMPTWSKNSFLYCDFLKPTLLARHYPNAEIAGWRGKLMQFQMCIGFVRSGGVGFFNSHKDRTKGDENRFIHEFTDPPCLVGWRLRAYSTTITPRRWIGPFFNGSPSVVDTFVDERLSIVLEKHDAGGDHQVRNCFPKWTISHHDHSCCYQISPRTFGFGWVENILSGLGLWCRK